ncbi:MAG: dihydrodipicolinate synthase family protein [Pirellulaceae bacterium]
MPIPSADPLIAVPMVTPFDERDRVDYGAAERNIERWNATPLSGFIVGTQSGEEFSLSFDEQLELARVVARSLEGERFLIGGIDCPSVAETLRRAEALAGVGAEAVRIRFPRNESVVEAYFDEVLPRCPVPVLLMHQCAPERFGAAAAPAARPEVLGAITQRDGVFGYVTDHDMRFEAQVRRHVPQDRRFWICNGSMILLGTLIGCNGTTTAFSNIWPTALEQLLKLGMAGRYDEARDLQEKVCLIDEIMLPYLAAGIKAALTLLGFEGMTPRLPTRPMPAAEVQRLEQTMRSAGLLPS